ncbi:MAG TPA: aminotransferase class I/II-fold pyridoxal phosphate-dependent enzyme [Longimicrobiales bacterium]|nr:aminotransferase class I/II-fold pyridoxal phosphate-dependent enzyme [Longimicrobiales bacterium]
MRYSPFRMERYQSTWEHRVEINLSESGVHPMTVRELLELAGRADMAVQDIRLGYGQSNGSDELRARIAALYPGATEASVLVTVGGAEANFTSFWHLLEDGATAAVTVPNYGQVPGLLETFGSRVLGVPLVESEGWQPDLDALEAALADGARFLLVTNPNNPTGAALTPASMDAIAELTERHGAWILSDEVYGGAEVEGDQTPSFWGRHERVLVTNSLSKAYGLPGLRLGWIVGPAQLVGDLWGRTDYTTISPNSLSDALATLALEPEVRGRILGRTRGIVRANLGLLRDWMAAQEGRFSYRAPDAGAICYARYDDPVNSTEFAEKLRTEKSVLVVPGDHFGMDRYLRIGFGNPEDELREGLRRIREAFDEVTAGVTRP